MKNQANSKRGNPKSEINLKELDDKLQEQTDSSIDGGGSSGGEKNIDDDFTDENPEINMDESHRFEMPEEDDNFALKIGTQGKTFVEENFDWETIVAKLNMVYKDLVIKNK